MRRMILMFCCFLFIVVFLWGYRGVVVPVYGYSGFIFNWPGMGTMSWAIVLSLIPLLVMPLELVKPSVLVLWWLYIMAYVPSMLLPVLTLRIPESTIFPLQLCVLCTMSLLCTVPYARTLALPAVVMPRPTFWWIFAIAWSGCIVIGLMSISMSQITANIALLLAGGSEYTVRADFATQVSQIGNLFGYVGRELCEALDPFLMAFGFLSRKWWMLTLGMFGQLTYFGQTGMKEVPFAIVLMLGVWLLYRHFRKQFGKALLLAVAVLVTTCTCVDLSNHNAMLSTLFTRRAMAGPGLLTGFYFEHYSTMAHPGHSFSKTGSFQASGPPQEIGFYYFGSGNVDANANFWAEGFAEYGILGIISFAALVAFSLWIYDSIATRRSLDLAVLLAVIQADALTNSSPLTVLVTHGGILAGLLLYFAPEISRPSGATPSSERFRSASLAEA